MLSPVILLHYVVLVARNVSVCMRHGITRTPQGATHGFARYLHTLTTEHWFCYTIWNTLLFMIFFLLQLNSCDVSLSHVAITETEGL